MRAWRDLEADLETDDHVHETHRHPAQPAAPEVDLLAVSLLVAVPAAPEVDLVQVPLSESVPCGRPSSAARRRGAG